MRFLPAICYEKMLVLKALSELLDAPLDFLESFWIALVD